MVLLHDRTAADRLIMWSAEPLNVETPAPVLCRSPVTPVGALLVRTCGPVSAFDAAASWLTVGRRVRTPLSLSLAALESRA